MLSFKPEILAGKPGCTGGHGRERVPIFANDFEKSEEG